MELKLYGRCYFVTGSLIQPSLVKYTPISACPCISLCPLLCRMPLYDPTVGHDWWTLGWFLCWIIANNAVRNFLVSAFWCIYVRVFARCIPGSMDVASRVRLSSVTVYSVCFPTWLYQFVRATVQESSLHHITEPLALSAVLVGVWEYLLVASICIRLMAYEMSHFSFG